ncbi:hypothetical protein ACOMHN_032670 [Nucella lapillus]
MDLRHTAGAYVALTLMGKPNSPTSPGGSQPPSSPSPDSSNAPSNRNSRITAPQPVAPDKDRELQLQKVHMTQAMFEQAKEDFQKHQRLYVKTPSEKLHTQLLEKERTVKTLENQLRQLIGSDEPSTPSATQGSQRFSDIDQLSNADTASLNSWPHTGSVLPLYSHTLALSSFCLSLPPSLQPHTGIVLPLYSHTLALSFLSTATHWQCPPSLQPHTGSVLPLYSHTLALSSFCLSLPPSLQPHPGSVLPLYSHTLALSSFCLSLPPSLQPHTGIVLPLYSHTLALSFLSTATHWQCPPSLQPHTGSVLPLYSHTLAVSFLSTATHWQCPPSLQPHTGSVLPLYSHTLALSSFCLSLPPSLQPHTASQSGSCLRQQQQQQQHQVGSEPKHVKQASVPASFYHSGPVGRGGVSVTRSKSDAASRQQLRPGAAAAQSTLSGGGVLCVGNAPLSGEGGIEATSLPVSDLGSMSDSPHTSPSISPTPVHPDNRTDDSNSLSSRTDSAIEDCGPMQPEQIITIDDEDVNSDEDQDAECDVVCLNDPSTMWLFGQDAECDVVCLNDPSTMWLFGQDAECDVVCLNDPSTLWLFGQDAECDVVCLNDPSTMWLFGQDAECDVVCLNDPSTMWLFGQDAECDVAVDTGPFSDIRLLDRKPAHMAVFMHYLISNNDPSPFFFYIVTDAYKQTPGNTKDLRKWGYEIFSTFLAPSSPLRVEVSEALVTWVNDILAVGSTRGDNDVTLRSMFDGVRAALNSELSEQLADFRSKRDLGLGCIFGVHELKENMDKNLELKMIDKYLMPHLQHIMQLETRRKLTDREQAIGWALATFFRQVGISKTASSAGILERVQSFIMKDKRGFKIPGRSAKAKTVKGHQFNLQHFYVPTMCSKCEGLIWGVGYQGFLCQGCDMGVHKQCVEDVSETCSGKKRGKRASAFIPVLNTSRKTSNPNPQAGDRCYSVTEALGQALGGETRSPSHSTAEGTAMVLTQPLRKDDETDLAGLPTEHSVKSIVNRYQVLYPTGPGPGEDGTAAAAAASASQSRKGSVDLSRSESLKGKGDKAERPARRAKSDVDRDDMFRALNHQSGSSSASSLSNRSTESPSASSEHVNDALSSALVAQDDSDLEVEELPSLKQVLGEDVLKKLKPKEKKRQEVINELFHTEKAHLRNLKVLDILFYNPMVLHGLMPELARALFPNIEEIIRLHASMNKSMKDRRSHNPVLGDVGDILLERFDGEKGDEFRKACAEYCRNQSFALEALKRHRRKDQRLSQFLTEAEADKLCRKLELKDHVPCQMQRLTKYPLLIENLLRHSQNSEYPLLIENLFRHSQNSEYPLLIENLFRHSPLLIENLLRHSQNSEYPLLIENLFRHSQNSEYPLRHSQNSEYPLLIENLLDSQEYKNLERALERSRHILAYVNTAVRECQNYHRLKEMQKKLDKRAIDASADPSLTDIKKLDLTLHKLVYDGSLVWRLRSHRQIELQVLLLEDILVLLQRVDERLVLKCQSTNQQAIGSDYKYTHSPVLKLQNLLARNVATDKKAFFVINTSDTGPQIYELVAHTQDARKTWCKLINEEAEKRKNSLLNTNISPEGKSTPSPERGEMEQVRHQILRKARALSPPPPPPSDQDAADGVFPSAIPKYQPELIQPDQVDVSEAVLVQAQPVVSQQERLRRTDQVIAQALEEKEQIVAEMLHMSLTEIRLVAQQQQSESRWWEQWEGNEQSLIVSCMQTNNRLLHLIAHRASSLISDPHLQGPDPASGSGPGSGSEPLSSESGPWARTLKLQQLQELKDKGLLGQNAAVPMDQLKGMANEMNNMLSNLLSVMDTKGEERKSLRTELQAAQDQLEMLKAIQRQMMSQQPPPSPSPSTPQSRPHSFVSVASSISESGETTDSDRQEEDMVSSSSGGGSQLKVALTQEVIESTEETVQQLLTSVQPQVATTTSPSSPTPHHHPHPDEDSEDDASDIIPDNLPLPDDDRVREMADAFAMCGGGGRRRGSLEPMTTDLDEGGGGGEEEGGRTTPTPSLSSMATVTEDDEREEDRDSVTTLCDTPSHPSGAPRRGEEDDDASSSRKRGDNAGGVNNNNSSSSADPQLTNPIEI